MKAKSVKVTLNNELQTLRTFTPISHIGKKSENACKRKRNLSSFACADPGNFSGREKGVGIFTMWI